MADIQRTIEIVFGAIDNTGDGFSSVADGMNSLVSSASNVTQPLSNVADQALKAEAAVLAMGATFLTVAVNEASKFGEKVEEIGSLVNATPTEVDALGTSIQNFAKNSTSDFDSIGKAVYIATSNLGDTSKAMDVLAVAEKGSIVGATDLESSTALLTRTMNAYGLASGTSEQNTAAAERVMAAMFVTVQNGDINMTSLSDNMGKIASTAAAANIPIETVGAAIAALTGAGVNAEQSTTLLNAVIKELLAPSDDLTKALGGLSITTDGLPKVMDALKTSTGGSADKIYALFSSSEAAKGALILANDSAGKFDGTLSAMGKSVETFNNNYTQMAGGVEDSNQKLVNQTTILLQKVGAPLQDGWTNILDGLASITSGFSLSIDDGSFDPVLNAFNGFGGDIANILKKIGENLPAALAQTDFSSLIASLSDLGHEISGLFNGADLTTESGLATAIQFVVDSFASLTNVVSGIITAWQPVVKAFIEGTDAFNGLESSTQKNIGQITGLAQVFETLKGVVTTGAGALDTIGNSLQLISGSQAATTIAGLAGSIGALPLVGVAATLAVVGGAIGANVDAWQAYKDKQADIATNTEHLNTTLTSNKEKLADISSHTGITVTNMDELDAAIKSGTIVFDEATGAYTSASAGIRDFDAEVSAASQGSTTTFADQVNAVAESLGLANDKGEKLIGTFSSLEVAEAAMDAEFNAGNQTFIRYEDGMYKVVGTGEKTAKTHEDIAKAVEDTSKSNIKGSTEWVNVMKVMQEATDSAQNFKIKAEEISEKRYEANLSALVDLKVAEIEADTARISAAFDSLNAGMSSTGETLVGLADIFANSGHLDSSKQEFLRQLVEEENARRQQQFDLQESLINNQNDYLRAKIEQMNSGQALITINSGDLAPELDSLFEKVLERVQIKATEEGFSLLLGLGAD